MIQFNIVFQGQRIRIRWGNPQSQKAQPSGKQGPELDPVPNLPSNCEFYFNYVPILKYYNTRFLCLTIIFFQRVRRQAFSRPRAQPVVVAMVSKVVRGAWKIFLCNQSHQGNQLFRMCHTRSHQHQSLRLLGRPFYWMKTSTVHRVFHHYGRKFTIPARIHNVWAQKATWQNSLTEIT